MRNANFITSLISMVHVQKRISVGMEVIQFFTMRNWKFIADNLEGLLDTLTEKEKIMFYFDSKSEGDEREYLLNSLLGGRQYCLKEPLSNLPKARRIYKM